MKYRNFQALCFKLGIEERVGEWNFGMVQKNAEVEDFDAECEKVLEWTRRTGKGKMDYIGAGAFRTWMKAPIDVH